jgi:hypothetical protein
LPRIWWPFVSARDPFYSVVQICICFWIWLVPPLFSIVKLPYHQFRSVLNCFSHTVGLFHFLSPPVLHHMSFVLLVLQILSPPGVLLFQPTGVGKLPKPLSPPTTCSKWQAPGKPPRCCAGRGQGQGAGTWILVCAWRDSEQPRWLSLATENFGMMKLFWRFVWWVCWRGILKNVS